MRYPWARFPGPLQADTSRSYYLPNRIAFVEPLLRSLRDATPHSALAFSPAAAWTKEQRKPESKGSPSGTYIQATLLASEGQRFGVRLRVTRNCFHFQPDSHVLPSGASARTLSRAPDSLLFELNAGLHKLSSQAVHTPWSRPPADWTPTWPLPRPDTDPSESAPSIPGLLSLLPSDGPPPPDADPKTPLAIPGLQDLPPSGTSTPPLARNLDEQLASGGKDTLPTSPSAPVGPTDPLQLLDSLQAALVTLKSRATALPTSASDTAVLSELHSILASHLALSSSAASRPPPPSNSRTPCMGDKDPDPKPASASADPRSSRSSSASRKSKGKGKAQAKGAKASTAAPPPTPTGLPLDPSPTGRKKPKRPKPAKQEEHTPCVPLAPPSPPTQRLAPRRGRSVLPPRRVPPRVTSPKLVAALKRELTADVLAQVQSTVQAALQPLQSLLLRGEAKRPRSPSPGSQ